MINVQKEILFETKIKRHGGYLYYINNDGNVERRELTIKGVAPKTEVLKVLNIVKEKKWLYFINEEGNVARVKMSK